MVPYFPDFIQNTDISILNWIYETFSCAFLDAVMPVVTFFGNGGWLWIAMAILMLFSKKTRKVGLAMGAALILGLIFGNGILKNLFARVRPYELEGALTALPIIGKQSDFSFPSGHTLASFEAASVLILTRKQHFGWKLAAPALFLAVLIAFSRLYLYVHFPSDILGGLILGCICGVIGVKIVDAAEKKLLKKEK